MSRGTLLRVQSWIWHVIPRKGLDEDGVVVDEALQNLEWLGHTRIISKADNERAIQALARRAIELAKIDLKDLEQLGKEGPWPTTP